MKFKRSKIFKKMYQKLPEKIQLSFLEKGEFLKQDFRHPSLRSKKMKSYKNPEIWEFSISMNFRVTFEVRDDLIVFRKIGTHDLEIHQKTNRHTGFPCL